MSINVFQSQPKGSVVFTSSQNWTVPPDVYRIKVLVIGGGGGGGGGYSSTYTGGGGASGAVMYTEAIVIPGETLGITVGAGGSPGTGGASPTAGGNGGNSAVLTSTGLPLSAPGGGRGGGAATSSANGTNGSGGILNYVDGNRVIGGFGLNGTGGNSIYGADPPVLPLGATASGISLANLTYSSDVGSGAGGGGVNANGGSGTAGIVIIWWGD